MLFLAKKQIDQAMSVAQILGWRGRSPKEGEVEGEESRRGAGAGRNMAALSVNSDLLRGG